MHVRHVLHVTTGATLPLLGWASAKASTPPHPAAAHRRVRTGKTTLRICDRSAPNPGSLYIDLRS